jgi:hypothetical protein
VQVSLQVSAGLGLGVFVVSVYSGLHLVAKRIEAKVEPQIEHNHPKLHQTIHILPFKIFRETNCIGACLKK